MMSTNDNDNTELASLSAKVRDSVLNGNYTLVARCNDIDGKVKRSRAWNTFRDIADENGTIVQNSFAVAIAKKYIPIILIMELANCSLTKISV